MSDRYSVLRPLTMNELEELTIEMIKFFSPLKAKDIREMLGLQNFEGQITPLSVNDFFKYLEDVKGQKGARRYHYHVLTLVKKLEQANVLYSAGSNPNFSMGLEKCYYFMKELTDLQKTNWLWLGEALGLEYIQYKAQEFLVPITGVGSEQKVGIGTGTLVNNDTVMTCAHVLTEMTVDKKIKFKNKEIKIVEVKTHDLVDVGIIKLSEPVDLDYQLIFGKAYMLDDILTMGFPPVPMTRDAYLVSQKGEINSSVQNYDGVWHFIYSSITRPGNSGGPIFTNRGQLVGISARHLEREIDKDKNVVPFFEGIPSVELIKALRELESSIKLLVEDYQ